ncbi:hypothetical protein BDZ45DRAFT_674587 [Acephala macrosclerotiorum]|nr:hypothetical protein BDZ45DRAFT_674587 [Acephala macrosclerotiorum]
MDARNATQNSRVDIFARENKEQVAGMLHRHLRWLEGSEDNLVSWTGSLLFTLVYIFHLHANSRDGSAFDDISLRIIDTTKFPKAVFIRDMDLLQVYFPFNAAPENFKGLRLRKDWYFGEYLSQGALKIEDKCQIVSAQAIIDRGLYDLRREFEEFSHWELSRTAPWANPVVDLRKDLCQIVCPEINEEKLQVAVNIAQLLESRWVLPVAANLVALLPHSKEDIAIIKAFRANVFTGRVREAENQLRHAVRFAMNQSLERQDSALLDSINEAVKGRLDMEAAVSQQLWDIIGSRQAFP